MPEVVAAAGPGLRDVSVAEPSLETAFIALTGRGLRSEAALGAGARVRMAMYARAFWGLRSGTPACCCASSSGSSCVPR